MKILTPNSLEDEDSTSSMLSQEEVEAFQNMIVNLLVSDYRIFVATAKDIVFLELVITRDIYKKKKKSLDYKEGMLPHPLMKLNPLLVGSEAMIKWKGGEAVQVFNISAKLLKVEGAEVACCP